MLKIYPKANSGISLGRSGEENARQICFDISGWRELYGEGVVQLLHQRTSDADPYPVEVTVDGDAVLWTVTLADTSEPGHGKAELQYRVGDTVAKSVTWATFVGASLGTPTDTPPEAQQGWVDKVLAAGASAENAAQRAEDAAERAEDAGVSDADVAKAVADYLAENPVNAEVSQEQIEEAVRDYILKNPIEGGVTDEQIASAVEDYLTKNPIDGGITEEADPTVPDWAKTALTAEVGQYLRVSAVDDNGIVTAVETVDAPSGGGEDEYVLILNKTLETAIANTDEWGGESHLYGSFRFWTTDIDGNELDLDGVYLFFHFPGQSEVTSGELKVVVGQGKPSWWGAWVEDQSQPYIGWPGAVESAEKWYSYSYDLRTQTLKSQQVKSKAYEGNYQMMYESNALSFPQAVAKNGWDHWSGVQISLVSGSLPAGTEIFIYGRKRNADKVAARPRWEVST